METLELPPKTGGYWEGYTCSLGDMRSGLLPAGPPGELMLQALSPSQWGLSEVRVEGAHSAG